MKLQMLGCSFHQTAVDFRERLNFSGPELSDTLKAFRQEFPNSELVLLSTCNRTELYTSTAGSEALDREEVITFLARQQNLTAEELLDRLIYRSGASAVEHLFTVAASLDSMVIGEAQILSQVKQAYDRACTFGSAGPLTHSVFQAANRAAKRVQTETAIHRRRVSVPSVAVGEVIPDFFDSIDNKSVLVVGAGEMAEETLRYLRTAGARQITLLNRTFETAATMAAQFECRCDRFETLPDQLHTVDIVVTTTSAPNYIIEKSDFAGIAKRRRGRMLLILDLAVPRDVDPDLDQFENVYVYGIDDLQAACQRNRDERKKEWPKAKTIIEEETQRFMQAFGHRSTGPVIRRLREQAGSIRDEELERLISKLQLGSDDAMSREIEKSFDRLINKLLHPPLASLRDDAAEGHNRGLVDALRHLFKLGDSGDE